MPDSALGNLTIAEMRHPGRLVASLAAAACLCLQPAPAGSVSFRCGASMVSEGWAATTIVARCGEPISVVVVREPVLVRRPDGTLFESGETVTEYWRYERGWGKFPACITIVDGTAVRIEFLSRTGGHCGPLAASPQRP